MKQGPVEQAISKTAQRLKGKAPEKFTARGPELRRGLSLFYDAFWELDSERSHGSGYQRIPWQSVIAYAKHYQLSDEQTEDIVTHITAMDIAYIAELKSIHESQKASK